MECQDHLNITQYGGMEYGNTSSHCHFSGTPLRLLPHIYTHIQPAQPSLLQLSPVQNQNLQTRAMMDCQC